MSTAIQWTDETWNVVTGCDRVSPGCDHCYIERTFPFRKEGRRFDEHGKMGIRFHRDRLDKPLHWRKPRRVFVNSLSDLFHPDVPEFFICDVFRVMQQAERHTFQVLTKRPQRMARLASETTIPGLAYPLKNVWLGTSVENQRYTDLRLSHLLDTPAAVRFLSIEPLLGPIDLTGWVPGRCWPCDSSGRIGEKPCPHCRRGVLPSIDWMIVGGESGPGARPMEREWAESIVTQCKAAGVAVFVKQLGTVLGGKDHHDIDSFPASLRVREFPASSLEPQ